LRTVFVDHPDLADTDLVVYAERSSYGKSPSKQIKKGAAEATPSYENRPAVFSIETGSPEGIR
jgi:hypothetical protein